MRHAESEVVREVDQNYRNLKWRSRNDLLRMAFELFDPYPRHIENDYVAKLSDGRSVRIEFMPNGMADTRRRILGNWLWPFGENHRLDKVQTYVLKLEQNGTIINRWVFKELTPKLAKTHAIVEKPQIPTVKSLYLKVKNLNAAKK